MNTSPEHNTYFFNILLSLFIGTLLAALLYFGIKHSDITVTFRINAENPNTMALYWPDDSGIFSGEDIIASDYPAGSSTQTLIIDHHHNNFPLRFDPNNWFEAAQSAANHIIIKNVIFSKLGFQFSLTGKELYEYIEGSHEIDIKPVDQTLHLSSDSHDPQIYFVIPDVFYSKSNLLFSYCFCFLLLLLLFLKYKNSSIIEKHKNYTFIFFITPLCAGIFLTHGFWQLILTSLLVTALTTTLILALKRTLQSHNILYFITNLLPVVVFLLLIAVPSLLTIDATSFIDEILDPPHAANPETTDDTPEKIQNKVRTSLKLNHYFREDLLDLNANTKLSLFGDSPTSQFIIGKDDTFFEGHGRRKVAKGKVGYFDNISDHLGLVPFTQKELEQWQVALEERYYWLKEKGIDFIFVMAPNKSQIFPEKYPELPDSITIKEESRRYDQLVNYLKKHSIVPIVDLKEKVLQVKEKINQGELPNYSLYFRTDGHLTAYGSFWTYKAIIEGINKYYPNYTFPIADINDFDIRIYDDIVYWPIKNMFGLKEGYLLQDTEYELIPKTQTLHRSDSGFVEHGVHAHMLNSVDMGNKTGQIPLLFLVGDSFIHRMAGFFSAHTQRLHHYRIVTEFQPDVIEALKPNIYVQEILNMYLLYNDAPENPEMIKSARKRALQNL